MQSKRLKAVFAGHPERIHTVFKGWEATPLSDQIEILGDPFAGRFDEERVPVEWSQAEVIFGTWGMPVLTKSLLDQLPFLQAVFYAAGSVRPFVTPASWERGIRIFSSARANAIPVAEFTFAQVVLSLKAVPQIRVRSRADWVAAEDKKAALRGNFAVRVGLISFGIIARRVRELLRTCDHEVVVYDPFLTVAAAEEAGVSLVSLDELFATCEVVSLHTPLLPSTRGLIRGHHLASMKAGATFINTARGAVVNQAEMGAVLRERSDLTAILDVLEQEPPVAEDPLFSLPNVWIYPHLAGAIGHEYQRFLLAMSETVEAYRDGRATPYEIMASDMDLMA